MAETLSSALSTASSALSSATTAATRALSSAPSNDAYLRWDAPGVESPVPNEEATALEIAEVMNRMQRRNFDKHRKAFRATHVKTQGIVKGKLKVKEDLPEHLRQGIFEKPGESYDVVARYANEPIFLQEDQAPGPRGMAIKVFGVSGERLDGESTSNDNFAEHAGKSITQPADPSPRTTQDFFFNNAPMLELTDVSTTLDIMRLREKYFDNPTQLAIQTKLRTDAIKQSAPAMLPNTNMISHEMFTQSAFRFGEWYGHMGLFPVKTEMTNKSSEKVTSSMPENQIKDWLFDYFSGEEAIYEFRIQLGTDPSHHPTEDASVVWSSATAPWQTVGTLSFPPQDSFSNERRVFWEDHMYLNPWRPAGLAAHRPLGSVNRLRKVVYAASRKQRDEINVGSSRDVEFGEVP